jgi:hypothetical protein
MDAVEDYARRWIKREVDQDPELESLSDWVRRRPSEKLQIAEEKFEDTKEISRNRKLS